MRRRDLLALGTLALTGACGRKKGTGYFGYALIATAGENSLAVVDLNAFVLREPIPLPGPPTAVIPSSRPGFSYVLIPSRGSIQLLDDNLRPVRQGRLADKLSEFRVTPDGRHIVAISAESRELIKADATSLKVLQRHKLKHTPVAIDVPPAPIGGGGARPPYVAVAGSNPGSVELFDLATGQRWRVEGAGKVGSVRFRFDGNLLLVADLSERVMTVLTTPELKLLTKLSLAMEPQNLCFSADGGQLFVSGDGMDAVAIIFPYNNLEVDQTVLAGHDPGVMVCSDTPPYLFVASHSGSDVSILNVNSRKVIGLCEVGSLPRFMTVTPDGQYALILDEGSGDLAVIRIPAIRANRDKTGVALFTVLPVGQRPVHAGVVPRV